MPRYTIRLKASQGDAETLSYPAYAKGVDAAVERAQSVLYARRRFAWHGERYDEWEVLYDHLHGRGLQVLRHGRFGE